MLSKKKAHWQLPVSQACGGASAAAGAACQCQRRPLPSWFKERGACHCGPGLLRLAQVDKSALGNSKVQCSMTPEHRENVDLCSKGRLQGSNEQAEGSNEVSHQVVLRSNIQLPIQEFEHPVLHFMFVESASGSRLFKKP